MKKINRRKALEISGQSVLSAYVLWLSGCGVNDSRLLLTEDEGKLMHDIYMEGWSTLGSGFLGRNGKLAASTIKANQEVTLDYIQDSHGHRFTLLPEHFYRLFNGEKVEVLTTEMLNHRHRVVIDPKKIDKNSSPVRVFESDFGGAEKPEQPEEEIPVAISGDQEVDVYFATNSNQQELQSEAFVCTAELKACEQNQLWRKAGLYKELDGKKVWVLRGLQPEDPMANSISLHLGVSNNGQIALKRSLKISK